MTDGHLHSDGIGEPTITLDGVTPARGMFRPTSTCDGDQPGIARAMLSERYKIRYPSELFSMIS